MLSTSVIILISSCFSNTTRLNNPEMKTKKDVFEEVEGYCVVCAQGTISLQAATQLLIGVVDTLSPFQINISDFSPNFKQAIVLKAMDSEFVKSIEFELKHEISLEQVPQHFGQYHAAPLMPGRDQDFLFYPEQFQNTPCKITLICRVNNGKIRSIVIRPDC